MEVWKKTGAALAQIKAHKLKSMDADDTRQAIRNILEGSESIFARLSPSTTTGLVEQQKLFRALGN